MLVLVIVMSYVHFLCNFTYQLAALSTQPNLLPQVEMALEALYNVIHNNAGVETQCNGHFKLLFSFFRFQGAKKLQMLTLKVQMYMYD